MAKKITTKRIFKIIAGVFVFFTLPSLLFVGFLYLRYNTQLPDGKLGHEADNLAKNMLQALNYKAYEATDYLEWTFKGIHHYKWHKSKGTCEVSWKHYKVNLNLINNQTSKVYIANQKYNGLDKQKLINKATDYFNNDSFWLVAPYKVFDIGAQRRLVTLDNGKAALLVTYTQGGSTPGDSYLWHLDETYKPTSYQMWVDILQINGLEATWENWITTNSGAQLSTFHKFMFFGIELTNVTAN